MDVVGPAFDLAGVQAGSELQPEAARVVAQLDRWCAAGSALLLFSDDFDHWQLLAPDGAPTGLSVLEVSA